MRINELMEIVHRHYPDGYTRNYWDDEKGAPRPFGSSGDRLAKFIVQEITETYSADESSEEQLEEAMRVMRAAVDELERVIGGLRRRQRELDPA